MPTDATSRPPESASPALAAGLAIAVTQVYAEAEAAILAVITLNVRAALSAPVPGVALAGRSAPILTATRRALDDAERHAATVVPRVLAKAYERGHGAQARAGAQATQNVLERLAALRQGVLHWVGQLLNRLVAALRTPTPLPIAGHAMQQAAGRGITGFADRHGRSYGLDSYVHQTVQHQAGQAAIDGFTDRLADAGDDLVIVTESPHPCPLCDPWEHRVLSVSGRDPHRPSMATAREAGLFHPNCFPGDVLVSAPSGVRAADSRWYEGDVVVIHTASGQELTVTPNHPILTPEGWIAAGLLVVGDRVLRYGRGVQPVDSVGPGDEQVPARIGDVFDALRQALPVPPTSVPGSAEQFHGDGGNADVETVFADGLLRDWAERGEMGGDGALIVGGSNLRLLTADGSTDEFILGAGHAPDGGVSGGGVRGSLCARHLGVAAALGLAPADASTALLEPPGDEGLIGAMDGRDLGLRLSGLVSPDEIVNVGVREFAAHVYNLQTGDGWYVANGIVVHNCHHTIQRWYPGFVWPPHSLHNLPGTYEATQRQRDIERHIRSWKRRQAAALDDVTKAKAGAKVRAWQAELRHHLAAEDLTRSRQRERTDYGHTPPFKHAHG